ncbi:MAG: IS66 family insertion sequence element accessory protein TnpB [Bacteroidia bacterium]|nr:IS66 family insertion sequence element accessory protein TnpB [Bacteroidia bacterium]
MLSLGPHQRYFLYTGIADMRKGFDGLSGLVSLAMAGDPLSGDVFLFVNRRRDRMKLLVWDRSGFVLWYKRLESGTFELPKTSLDEGSHVLSWQKLVLILEGVKLDSVVQRKRFSLPEKVENVA